MELVEVSIGEVDPAVMISADLPKFRVGIAGVLHESNSFVADVTTHDNFYADIFLSGPAIVETFADAPHEIGGFIAGLRSESVAVVPIFAARATPSGVIERSTWQSLAIKLWDTARHQGALDGLLIAVHGAAVGREPSGFDVDGYLLEQLRNSLAPQLPIIATLDLHANLSQKMVDATMALIGYRTNPHIDQRERGLEAARLMARTLRGEVKPTMAAALPPVAINIERQLTAEPPCRELYARADAMLREPRVLSNSVLLGFPYADVPEMGSSVVVVTDNDRPLAQKLADQLASYVVDNREQFRGHFLSIDDALQQAVQLEGPVCLLDMGDNVGGGSPGDGTALARAIQSRLCSVGDAGTGGRDTSAAAFVCINDALAADLSAQRGVGAQARLEVGGRGDKLQGPPLAVEVTVVSLHDGKFTETGTTHGGITQFDQGPTAIVRTNAGLTIMLTSKRTPPFSLRQLTAFGICPTDYQIVVAKGVHAPRAAYAAACKHFLRVDTPGVTRADMTKLQYHHRRRPLFPFEDVG